MLGAFGVFCFVYPFATVLLSFDWMPFGMEWMSSLLLLMLGLASWAWLVVNFGGRGLLLGGIVLALGVALEYVGVLTGVPFGEYSYTGVLVPELPGGVPLAIGFAWLLVITGGLFTAIHLVGSRAGGAAAIAVGAALAMGLDLLLEPVAFHVKNYWRWAAVDAGYYGVPWSNFVTWFAAALLLNTLVYVSVRDVRQLRWGWLPVALYAMNVAMFGTVCATHGFWVSGLIALLLMYLIAWFMVWPASRRLAR